MTAVRSCISGFNRFVNLLFLTAIIFLAGSSCFYVSQMNFRTLEEESFITMTNPLMIIAVVAAASIALLIIALFLRKMSKGKTIARYLSVGVVVLFHLAVAVFLIKENGALPHADQMEVWNAATELANGEMISHIDYFTYYPFQAGMMYPMMLLIKFVGSSDPVIWRVVNVFALIFIDIGIISISEEFIPDKKESASVISGILAAFLLPAVIYVTYVYGTLLGIALSIWAFFGCIKLFHSDKAKWGLLPVLCLPLANKIYSGTLIATIAVVIALLLEALLKKRKDLLIIVLLILSCSFAEGKIIRHQLYLDTGIEETVGGVPATAYMYMGMTADEGAVSGPGSYDGASMRLYNENGEDTSGAALKKDLDIIGDYFTGQRNFGFFWEKTIYQWLNPYFDAVVMTIHDHYLDELSDNFSEFVFGDTPKKIFEVLKYYNVLIYLWAIAGGIHLWKDKHDSCAALLLLLYFVGGFVFQFVWESKPRYCMPYFIMLIPIATYGIISTTRLTLKIKTFNDLKPVLLMVLAEVLVFVVYAFVQNASNEFYTEIKSFYSDFDQAETIYVDASYEQDQQRALHSEEMSLKRGIYDVDVRYTSDLPKGLREGGKVFLWSKGGQAIINSTEKYHSMDENGHNSFSVFVPFDDTAISLKIWLENDRKIHLSDGRAGYILMDHAIVQKNGKETSNYLYMRLIALMIFASFVLMIIYFTYLSGEKNDKLPIFSFWIKKS